jgi:hypothetical protein
MTPSSPVTIEVQCADGAVALVHGVIETAPSLVRGIARRVGIVEAVPLAQLADFRDAA